MDKKFISKSEQQTREVAHKFASGLKRGDIVLLQGDLGAGKTAFVKGVVEFFHGDKSQVTSPTFTIVNEYELENVVIYHFDLYRLEKQDELYNIGFEEYFYSDAICFIEWPERADNFFNEDVYKIVIKKLSDKSREIMIEDKK